MFSAEIILHFSVVSLCSVLSVYYRLWVLIKKITHINKKLLSHIQVKGPKKLTMS